jgi:hypothetical protein
MNGTKERQVGFGRPRRRARRHLKSCVWADLRGLSLSSQLHRGTYDPADDGEHKEHRDHDADYRADCETRNFAAEEGVRCTVWRAAVVVAHVWVCRGVGGMAGEDHGCDW